MGLGTLTWGGKRFYKDVSTEDGNGPFVFVSGDGPILTAKLKTEDGDWLDSELLLDERLENNDGVLEFSEFTANEPRLKRSTSVVILG